MNTCSLVLFVRHRTSHAMVFIVLIPGEELGISALKSGKCVVMSLDH